MSKVTERIDHVLKSKGISKQEFYSSCEITSSAYSQWNTGKTEPKPATLRRIAKFLDVNYEWLSLGAGEKENAPTLTKKDERDIEKRLAEVLADLEGNQDGLMFSGEAMDETTRELLAASLRNSMEIGKTLAKQKFTPKKYREEG